MKHLSYVVSTQIKARWHGATRTASKIKYLVFHFTGNGGTTATAKANANYFATTTRKASAHFVIDERQTIYQTVNPLVVAYSVGDSGKGKMKGIITNTNSISIEMVSHSIIKNPQVGKDQYYIPQETLDRAIEFAVVLMKKYNIPPSRVYRHHDVTGKLCPDNMCVTAKGEALWADFKKRLTEAYNGKAVAKEDDEVVTDIKTNLLGKETTVKGIFKEGKNYLACDAFKEMGLNVTSNGSQPVVNVQDVTVVIDGQEKVIKGFNGNGTNYCSIRQIAEILGKEVGWEDGKITIK